MVAGLSAEEWERLLDLPAEESVALARARLRGRVEYEFPLWPPVIR